MAIQTARGASGTSLDILREHRSGMRGSRERRARPAQFEFRSKPDGTGGIAYSFQGYAATFEQPFDMWDAWGDPYQEVLSASACNRTLANQADVQFLIGHDESGIPLARTKSGTMSLSTDASGLHVSVPSLDGRSPIVQSLASAMERGDMDEMSIGFLCTQQEWSPDWMTRRINEISLNRGDVSVVCWAANPNANGAAMAAVPVSEAAARAAGLGRERRTPTEPYSVKPGETAECPQCHSMNDTQAAYCDQCGTAIKSSTVVSSASEDQTQRCPCGTWNAPDAKFCRDCGENIASDNDADNGGWGNGIDTVERGGYWSARRAPAEGRASQGVEPDFSTKPPQNLAAHGEGSITCPNGECASPNAADAAYCDQCGECLYDEGGLIRDGQTDDVVTDTSGLVEEEDMVLARQRKLTLLKLRAL
jgi:HK97 family phage prohead protease